MKQLYLVMLGLPFVPISPGHSQFSVHGPDIFEHPAEKYRFFEILVTTFSQS